MANDNGKTFTEKRVKEIEKMTRDICDTKIMAESAYRYQTMLVMSTLMWLDENGYEIKKRIGLVT